MATKVFISYRRIDAAGHAGRVHDRLTKEFGANLLFMDVDGIPLGVNFVKALHDEVAKCGVLLAVIGPDWLNVRDKDGKRRLDNPNDFVRVEIAAALQRDIPVIPILLEGTTVPSADQLPKDLQELSLRNGLDVRHASFHNDVDRLVQSLKGQLPEAAAKKRRRDEDERRPQEAEDKRRLDAAAAKKRREEERRRQEAEDKRRLDAAAAKKRQQDEEERRRVKEEYEESVARLEAAKVEGRRLEEKRVSVAKGEQAKPWLLSLIGAVTASSMSLFLAVVRIVNGRPLKGGIDYDTLFVLTIILALSGGVAGMLVQRFGILRALGIAGIPVILLCYTVLSFIGPPLRLSSDLHFVFFVGYLFTWIAFDKLNESTW